MTATAFTSSILTALLRWRAVRDTPQMTDTPADVDILHELHAAGPQSLRRSRTPQTSGANNPRPSAQDRHCEDRHTVAPGHA